VRPSPSKATAFAVALPSHVVAFDPEEVKDHECERDLLPAVQQPLADLHEVGLAVGPERDQLPVEHPSHGQLREDLKVRRHVPTAAAANTKRTFSRDDRAEAVPLNFVCPSAASRKRPGSSKHRFRECAVRHGRRDVGRTLQR